MIYKSLLRQLIIEYQDTTKLQRNWKENIILEKSSPYHCDDYRYYDYYRYIGVVSHLIKSCHAIFESGETLPNSNYSK